MRSARSSRIVTPGLIILGLCSSQSAMGQSPPPKQAAVFYPPALVDSARANVAGHPWASQARKQIVQAAEPWMKLSDDDLWNFMFGPTITRSWMVLSYGCCPACKKDVRMYFWEIDAFARPWKCRCPHCKTLFPKNDFGKFYRSGLDEHGVFDPKRADRSLLFNTEHPDAADPLHTFGVDDGNGYVEGKNCWRFIGTYLVYGQWKQLIVEGIRHLAAAYVITGDPVYAHKAGILFDRVADLYPTFDFGKQAILYEAPAHRGYVSTWHDACHEIHILTLAYDQVFKALTEDTALPAFLSAKAQQYKIDRPKATLADIRRNIEQRIFVDTLNNRPKITSNYPTTDVAIVLIKAVLNWPDNRQEVLGLIDAILKKSTAVDGLTGEKGLAGYSSIGPHSLAPMLSLFARIDAGFLPDVLKRCPELHRTYRFHIDLWCQNGSYYPNSGDTGGPGRKNEAYAGLSLNTSVSLDPSNFLFLWKLYEATKDPAFVQVMYRANGRRIDGMPYDLLATDPAAFQQAVRQVIAAQGEEFKLTSVNKTQWHMAVLRSGSGPDVREVILDYDSGGAHGHQDGMNLGLFQKGLDLMIDYGYPPVSHGGWSGPRFAWYILPGSHNTVLVDGKGQSAQAGKTTLWADGQVFRAVRASAPAITGTPQFERTVAMIDTSDRQAYVVDIFRIVGGTDHAKPMHSHFATLSTQGLTLAAGKEYGHDSLMRNPQTDATPKPGWFADWKVDDRYQYLPSGTDVHLRYSDLTEGASVTTCEKWVLQGAYALNLEAWLPTVMLRRTESGKGPLASTFAGVFETYEKTPAIAGIRRLPLTTSNGAPYPTANVAAEVRLADGRSDLIVAADVENPLRLSPHTTNDGAMAQKDWGVEIEGDLAFVRRAADGKVERIAAYRCSSVKAGDLILKLRKGSEYVEITLDAARKTSVVAGQPQDILEMTNRDGPASR